MKGPKTGVAAFNAARAGLDPHFEVVGYLPTYQIKGLDLSTTEHLTDLVYFSLTVNSDGSLPIRHPYSEYQDFLQAARDRYGVRVIQGISDHRGSSTRTDGLSSVVNDKAARQAFVANLTTYLVENSFDGADLDWEYPRTWREKANYTLLLQDLKAAFAPYGFRLSVAISPGQELDPGSYAAVDRIHAMTYDDWGKHSSYAHSTDHVRALIGSGIPAAKLMMGIPFYGRGYYLGRSWSSALTYKSIQERYKPNPQQDLIGGYYFNGVETTQDKVKFARRLGLAGVMVWEIGQDTTDDTSLLKSITAVQQGFAPRLVQRF